MLSEKETVYLEKDFCQFREMIYNESWKRIREQNNEASKREVGQVNYCGLICPLCNGNLNVGDITYMVMNNHKLFPNTVIHKSCVSENLVNTTKTLKSKYEHYKKFLDENKAWI